MIDRRTVLMAALAAVPVIAVGQGADEAEGAENGFRVAAGSDRAGRERKVFGTLPITFKVTSQDTGGALLMIEQNNGQKGGPPRHLHHEQDEWFYVVRGEYVVEVGGELYKLGPGDSVFAPRTIPHAWAFVGDTPGTMVIGFQPAGRMEAFFSEATQLAGLPEPAKLEKLFSDHQMKLTGPPLKVG